MTAIASLEGVIGPAATEALGAASSSVLDAFFRDLAEASRGLPYEAARPKAHRTWLSLCCGDWENAEAAALGSRVQPRSPTHCIG